MLLLLAIGAGGALGSIARFLVSLGVQRWLGPRFPWATFLVNMSGSFLIGVAFGLADADRYSGDVLTFLVAGVLGGYTTFSTFSVENLQLVESGRIGQFMLNSSYQILGGLLLAAAGYWLTSVAI